jgi:hypothetical protein
VRQILQERLEQEVTAALGGLRHGRAEAVMRIQSWCQKQDDRRLQQIT